MEGTPPPSPKHLGDRFDVGPTLKSGVFCSVHLAFDAESNAPVELLVLRNEWIAAPSHREGFHRLATALSSLPTDRGPQVVARGATAIRPWIAVQPRVGVVLAEHLAKYGPLRPSHALSVAIQVCDVLAAAHARGVVHGPLTHEHVRLDDGGAVHLTDFGLDSFAEPIDVTDEIVAVARILVTAATGRLTPDVTDAPALLGRLGQDVTDIVTDCLGPQPTIKTAAALAGLLREAFKGTPAMAPVRDQKLGALDWIVESTPTNPFSFAWLLLIAALAVLAGVIGLGLAGSARMDDAEQVYTAEVATFADQLDLAEGGIADVLRAAGAPPAMFEPQQRAWEAARGPDEKLRAGLALVSALHLAVGVVDTQERLSRREVDALRRDVQALETGGRRAITALEAWHGEAETPSGGLGATLRGRAPPPIPDRPEHR